MKIVVTDHGHIWNHYNQALRKYKEDVLVISMYGNKNLETEYKVLASPYEQPCGIGVEPPFLNDSSTYNAIKSVAEKWLAEFEDEEDVLFLTDMKAPTLYPFHILKKYTGRIRLHLFAIRPLLFMQPWNKKLFEYQLDNLDGVTSIILFDANEMLLRTERRTPMPQFLNNMEVETAEYLDIVVKEIRKYSWLMPMRFDFKLNKYIQLAGVSKEDRNNKDDGLLMGKVVLSECDIKYSKETYQQFIIQLVPRVEGKEICQLLKRMRVDIAARNGIVYDPVECTSAGICAGTCAQCDEEAQYLRKELEKISETSRQYPFYEIKKKEYQQVKLVK